MKYWIDGPSWERKLVFWVRPLGALVGNVLYVEKFQFYRWNRWKWRFLKERWFYRIALKNVPYILRFRTILIAILIFDKKEIQLLKLEWSPYLPYFREGVKKLFFKRHGGGGSTYIYIYIYIFGMSWKKCFVKTIFLYCKFVGQPYSLIAGSTNMSLNGMRKGGTRAWGTCPYKAELLWRPPYTLKINLPDSTGWSVGQDTGRNLTNQN